MALRASARPSAATNGLSSSAGSAHMIEETARHAGHMDAIRELLDGQKGYY